MEQRGGRSRPRVWGALALGAFVVILAATLFPNPTGTLAALRTPLLCVVCGDQGGTDVVLNLLLFMPLAVALRLWGMSWGRTVVTCAAVSLMVETLQFTVIPGRDASLSDLLTNTAGGAIGATISRPVRTALFPGRDAATRLTLGMALCWLGMLATSAWLMAPWAPTGHRPWSRWSPDPLWPESFVGRVTGVESSGMPLPSGVLPDTVGRHILRQVRHGRIDLRAELISGPDQSNRRRWIYSLQVGPVLAPRLSQEGGDLLLELPVHALHLKLSAPALRLTNGMPRDSGRAVTITVSQVGGYVTMVSSYGGRPHALTLGIGPTQGWSVIAPFGIPIGRGARVLTALWIAGWLVPLGYWSARSRHRGGMLWLAIGAVALGLAIVPALAAFPPVHRSEWLAAGVALAIGRALAAFAAYLASRCGSPSASESSSS